MDKEGQRGYKKIITYTRQDEKGNYYKDKTGSNNIRKINVQMGPFNRRKS